MKQALLALLLAVVTLAGCSGDGDEDALDTEHTDTDTETTPGNGTANAAPVATLVADPAAPVAGEMVNFTWTVEDPDADDIDFTFDADGDGSADTTGTLLADNGTYAAFNFSFTYSVAGSFNATLNVTDGDASAQDTVVIEVLEATPDDAQGNATEGAFPLVLEGELTSPNENFYIVGAEVCDGWILPTATGDCEWFELPPEAAGLPYKTSGDGDVDVQFRASCGPTGLPSDEDYGGGADGHDEGIVPSDAAGCIIVANFADAGVFSVRIG